MALIFMKLKGAAFGGGCGDANIIGNVSERVSFIAAGAAMRSDRPFAGICAEFDLISSYYFSAAIGRF